MANAGGSYGKYGAGLIESGWIAPVVGGTGANTWAAKQYSKVPGYIFSDDQALGFYVTRIKS